MVLINSMTKKHSHKSFVFVQTGYFDPILDDPRAIGRVRIRHCDIGYDIHVCD